MTLSTVLKHAAESAFCKGYDAIAVRFADWAAQARDLEERARMAELRAALVSEDA